MGDIRIRIEGKAGRITFTRPQALNAMTYEMCMGVDAALRGWVAEDSVALVVIDAEGEKAFCAGGDIAELYETGTRGDFAYGRTFWRDEYRLNAFISEYPKPVVSLMQGFTMGGGVGIGCHATHRVVGESSRIAMPECAIGLVPDVGGSHLLACAPGRLGEYLGTTGTRMGPGDAIFAGFADHYVAQADWPALIADLERSGDAGCVAAAAGTAPAAALADRLPQVQRHFAAPSLPALRDSLAADGSDWAADALRALSRACPISAAATLEMMARLRAGRADMRAALAQEYRFTWRAMEMGDFLEGIRAQIIDKDRNPRWQFADMNVPAEKVAAMLAPLGENELTFSREGTR